VLATLLLAGAVTSFTGAVFASQSVAVPEQDGVSEIADDQAQFCQDCGRIYEHLTQRDPCEAVICGEQSYCDQETGSCTSYPEVTETVEPEQLAECPSSPLPLRLIGTVVDADGGWAHALLHNTETGLTSIRRPGDVLVAGHEVLDVEHNRVRVITDEGVDCLYAGVIGANEMRQQNPPRRRTSAEPLQTAPQPRVGDDGSPEPAVVLEDEAAPPPGTYRVARSLVDAVANDPGSVGAASTRINPEFNDSGETIGLRITGIGRSSALRQAGLRNGDVIVTVNWQAVNSPQRGIAVYQRLSTSSSVSVEVLRRGETRRLRVEVTD
jgi:type II secretory pathway component PulC